MSALQRPLTYDDLRSMPDDGLRREVIGGELVVTPAPSVGHQRVVGNLFRMLDDHARHHGGEVFVAPIDVRLGHNDIVQPDLIFMAATAERLSGRQLAIEGAPTVVFEVISPGSRGTDRVRKMALYARAGVPEYWIVDPLGLELAMYVLKDQEYEPVDQDTNGMTASVMLPGMRLDPGAVFAGID